ncbi:hypothetical protein PF011_g30418 [Phytophthora fragariae]|uniref:Uncharacterized protein n=1 Tax=Phytophthora fragariae TaxID=53985 RepID=A0A6A3GPD0_9STRA|nr:hypothetical protein PF011_g30418 [Phytophthora fragariae]
MAATEEVPRTYLHFAVYKTGPDLKAHGLRVAGACL